MNNIKKALRYIEGLFYCNLIRNNYFLITNLSVALLTFLALTK